VNVHVLLEYLLLLEEDRNATDPSCMDWAEQEEEQEQEQEQEEQESSSNNAGHKYLDLRLEDRRVT